MKVLLLVSMLLFVTPTYAYAESWTAEEPKPLGDSSKCTGYANFGGLEYTYTNWIPADSNAGWRTHYCHEIVLKTDMKRWFAIRGVTLPDSAISVLASP